MINFRKYLYDISFLTEEELQALESIGTSLALKKGAIIVRAGERFDKEVFVESGILRAYLIDGDGNEKSTAFFQEGEFMSTTTLRSVNGYSLASYQALCHCKVIFFHSKELKNKLAATKKLSELGKKVKEKETLRLHKRDNCLLQVKAIDKYVNFLACYPKLEQFISQRYIASYLGITPVAFSRLKKGI